MNLWFDGIIGFDKDFVEVENIKTSQIKLKIILPKEISFKNS